MPPRLSMQPQVLLEDCVAGSGAEPSAVATGYMGAVDRPGPASAFLQPPRQDKMICSAVQTPSI